METSNSENIESDSMHTGINIETFTTICIMQTCSKYLRQSILIEQMTQFSQGKTVLWNIQSRKFYVTIKVKLFSTLVYGEKKKLSFSRHLIL